jgi:hypothetical protein
MHEKYRVYSVFIGLCLVWHCFTGLGIAQADDALDQCLMIGEDGDPIKARHLFGEAMQAWRTGRRTKAIQLYEKSLIADRSVLRHDDDGMAPALLEYYEEQVGQGSPSAALLCRKGFFENIIVGDLEAAATEYEQAARIAATEEFQIRAGREAERLRRQLAYIKTWQEGVARRKAEERALDWAHFSKQTQLNDFDARIEALRDEQAELEERLAYLQSEEKDGQERMAEAMRRATRYRRRYYYPDTFSDPNPPVDDANAPGVVPPGQLSLYRMYSSRNSAEREREGLTQIRSETTGIQRRLDQIPKKIKEWEEKRVKEAQRPLTTGRPATPRVSGPLPAAGQPGGPAPASPAPRPVTIIP